MANTIKIKNSGTAASAPSALEHGELAINYADGKIYYKNSSNSIVEFSSSGGITISDTVPSSPSVGDLWYESDTGKTFVYYDSFWVEVGGDGGPAGPQGATGPAGTNGAQGVSSFLPMKSGARYQSPMGVAVGNAPATNTLAVVPIFITGSFTLTEISAVTRVFSSSGTARLGIYNSGTNGEPSSLLIDAGTISYTASDTGYAITISQPVTQGWYWLGCVIQSGSSTWNLTNNGANAMAYPTQRSFSTNSNNFITSYTTTGVTGALPSNPTWTASNLSGVLVRVVPT